MADLGTGEVRVIPGVRVHGITALVEISISISKVSFKVISIGCLHIAVQSVHRFVHSDPGVPDPRSGQPGCGERRVGKHLMKLGFIVSHVVEGKLALAVEALVRNEAVEIDLEGGLPIQILEGT